MRTPIGGLRSVAAAILALVTLVPTGAATQADPFNFRFTSGQSVAPIFDGWSRNPDGTFEMHFGYINRNHVEEVHVPIGADNLLESGPEDQGQPTFFYPRVHRQVFSITVPADFGDRELIWSLTMAASASRLSPGWTRLGESIPSCAAARRPMRSGPNQAPSLSISASSPAVNLPARWGDCHDYR